VRTFGCAGGLQARFHDLIAEADGGYWIMCDETRPWISALGRFATAQDGTWSARERHGRAAVSVEPVRHFDITDSIGSRTGATSLDPRHARDLDATATARSFRA